MNALILDALEGLDKANDLSLDMLNYLLSVGGTDALILADKINKEVPVRNKLIDKLIDNLKD